ncbi:MAG: type I methionyl aminopeptidase [Kiritimatiellaeota bacterium]|nr:type I methionyl aminopeptidase [Kiritimatiellota bacterium]
MIIVKTAEELDAMRSSGRLAAQVLASVARSVRPGVTTRELDELADRLIVASGAKSAFYGYRGYPGHICVSVNEEVVHGIPGPRIVQLGDVVRLGIGVEYRGFVGDTATTVMVGVTDPEVIRLAEVGQQALAAAMNMARAGRRLSDISHAVQQTAEAAGFSVVRDFVGHGVGRRLHEDPQIPNFGSPGQGPKLKPGMTFALEPMLNLGVAEVEVLGDGWTVVTRDRKPSVHFEHSVAIRDGEPVVLTWPD